MAGPSTSRALTEVEQETVLNEVLEDETLSNYSSDDGSASDYDYTQLVSPEATSASESNSDPEDIIHSSNSKPPASIAEIPGAHI